MSEVTPEQLQQDTNFVLDQLEKGETLVVVRNGRAIGKMGPIEEKPRQSKVRIQDWSDIMAEVWEAQKHVKPSEIMPNPVLEERRKARH